MAASFIAASGGCVGRGNTQPLSCPGSCWKSVSQHGQAALVTPSTSVPLCCHCCPGQRLWRGDGHGKGHTDGADPTLPRGQLGSPSHPRPVKQCHTRGCHPRSALLAATLAGTSPGDGFRDRSRQPGYLGGILRGMRSSEGFATTDKSKCPSE